jgi:Uma2 family endonuclease
MATATLLTVEEFEALDLGDDRYELWWGEVRPVPGGGMEHSGIGLGIGAELRAYTRSSGAGFVVGADCRFILSHELRLILVPDAAFVAAARVPAGEALRGSFDGAPDLAVEVVSPSDRSTVVDDKARTWLRFGARLVWVLRPRRHTVAVWTSDGVVRTLGEGEDLDGGEVLPGFRIPVAELFR